MIEVIYVIDFTGLPQEEQNYGGARGKKLKITYNDKKYMLKFPATFKSDNKKKYMNSCISEYIGCHVYDIIGIPVQETILGNYTNEKGKEYVVVACGDLTSDNRHLITFASLKNELTSSESDGHGKELSDILNTFSNQNIIDERELKNRFWDMFIVDALIRNADRHNDNWGIIYDSKLEEVSLSPVFDCGACLSPKISPERMKKLLDDVLEDDMKLQMNSKACIRIGGEKINYFNFISSLDNQDCNEALKRIVPRIDIDKINEIIDDIPCITELQNEFYKKVIEKRKEHILDFSLEKLLKSGNENVG